MKSIEALTLTFYDWEGRCRGWSLYNQPVDLEPPFEPFHVHASRYKQLGKEQYVDDGKSHLLSGLFSLVIPEKPHSQAPEVSDLEPFLFEHTDTPLCCFAISLPKGHKVLPETTEEILVMLSYSVCPISFEIIATYEKIRLQFVCRNPDRMQVYTQLIAYFPELSVFEYPEGMDEIIDVDMPVCLVDFGLGEESMRPVKMANRFDPDPYTGVFGLLEHLEEGQTAAIQILFQGVTNTWSESIIQSVTDCKGQSFFLDAPEMVPLAKEKVSAPLFAAAIRVIGQGSTIDEATHVLNHVGNGIMTLSRSHSNCLIPLTNPDYDLDTRAIDILNRQSHRLGMLLNSRELTTFVHFPSVSIVSNKLERDTKKTKAAPHITEGHPTILGTNYHHGKTKTVSISASQRLKHTHIIGATGTGKSTFLTNLIVQDIEHGNGLAVLDPHGDLIETILTHIPEHRYGDVVLIDPADGEYPVGFNILTAHSEIEKEILSSDLVSVFRRLSTSWGDQMNSVLANAILAFLESKEGGTLMDLRRFLIEKPFRDTFLITVTDPSIIYYWHREFPLLKSNSIGPILTRLDSFLRPKLIRNMVAQKKSLDFENFLDTRKIVLVKLSQGLIGNENSYLLGTFIVAKIHQAAMARQNKLKADRKDFYLYIDEFQHFITDSMSAMLSGARKYHVGLVLAHQDMQQLTKYDTELASSILSNAGTRVCFRVGEIDARKMEDGFVLFEAKDLQNLSTGEAIVRVERPEFDFNVATEPLKDVDTIHADNTKSAVIGLSRTTYGTPKGEIEKLLQELIKDYAIPEKEERPIVQLITEIPVPPPVVISEETGEPYPTKDPLELKAENHHRYLQSLIKRMAESRGYKALLEEPTPDGNGRVDIHLERNSRKIACEVCVTTTQEWELQNIQKCITAGYDTVVSISTDKKVLENIKKYVGQSISTELQKKILFYDPETFFSFLDAEIAKEGTIETRMKGYRINVKYNPVSEKEAKSKQDQILKAITNSKKPKK